MCCLFIFWLSSLIIHVSSALTNISGGTGNSLVSKTNDDEYSRAAETPQSIFLETSRYYSTSLLSSEPHRSSVSVKEVTRNDSKNVTDKHSTLTYLFNSTYSLTPGVSSRTDAASAVENETSTAQTPENKTTGAPPHQRGETVGTEKSTLGGSTTTLHPDGNSSTHDRPLMVTAQEMRDCHRSESKLLYTAWHGNVTVTGDGKEFMDVMDVLTCDVIVAVPDDKHVMFVHLVHWDYDCDYYFYDVFLVFDTSTGAMNSLLPYTLCISEGSQAYSSTNNVTLRFVWEPTGRPFRFVVAFRAVPESAPRTLATLSPPSKTTPAAAVTEEQPPFGPQSPERLKNGLWNCSTTPLSLLLEHFPCNLRKDCVGGEDEAPCSYTTDYCGLGKITVGYSCYQFFRPVANHTWKEAEGTCRARGGHLAILNTREEWTALYHIFRRVDLDTQYTRMAIGLQIAGASVPPLYRQLLQWVDNTIGYVIGSAGKQGLEKCGYILLAQGIYQHYHFLLLFRPCRVQAMDHFLCEIPPENKHFREAPDPEDSKILIAIPANVTKTTTATARTISTIRCPKGHLTHTFLACDVKAMCFALENRRDYSCSAPLAPLPPMFTCTNEIERVPYSSVCDHRADCVDGSDENFCTFSACEPLEEKECGNRECKPREMWCDFSVDCVSEADERQCKSDADLRIQLPTFWPPALVDFKMVNGSEKVVKVIYSKLQTTGQDILEGRLCPETHFQCPGNGFCLPIFLRCNQMADCPGSQDEDGCSEYTCPGFFRCRSSQVCVHAHVHVCDGLGHCPHRDDEVTCDFHCPEDCICYWNSFTCSKPTQVGMHSDLKYLDASGTGMSPFDVSSNFMLIYLKLESCNLTSLEFPPLPNLHSLVLSNNNLISIMAAHLNNLSSVQFLDLSGNPFLPTFLSDLAWPTALTNFKVLNFSSVSIPQLSSDGLSLFQGVEELYLRSCGVESIIKDGFQALKRLRRLDLQGSVVKEFPQRMLKGLDALQKVEADSYKLCCPAVLPEGFNYANCYAPQDEVSSCGDLLRSDIYMVLLSVFAALSLVCNSGSLLYRVFVEKVKANQGFAVFVTHLCAADLMMGLYLAIIGVVDRRFKGSYLWNDVSWRSSSICKLTGFLSLLSSEVSAFIICLITMDRFLVLKFPFSDLHFRRFSGHVACGIVWIFGLILGSVPLYPAFDHWKFYSQTGICLPLPVTRTNFPGQDYSFGVMIVLNFVLFILIVLGQGIIFWAIRTGSLSAMDSSKKSKDLAIARHLISVALSDFLCWFPIGILGLMASQGTGISGDVNVAIAIIVLPINSVLNPFLYTLNIIMDIRQRARDRLKQKNLLLKIQQEAGQFQEHNPKRSEDDERSAANRHHARGVTRVQAHSCPSSDGKGSKTGFLTETEIRDVNSDGSFQSPLTYSEMEALQLLSAWLQNGMLTQEDLLHATATGAGRTSSLNCSTGKD